MKKLFFVFLLTLPLFTYAIENSQNSGPEYIIQCKQVAENVLYVKALLKNINSDGGVHALKDIRIKLGEQTLFYAIAGEIFRRQLIKFYTMDIPNEPNIELILTFNDGTEISRSWTIVRKTKYVGKHQQDMPKMMKDREHLMGEPSREVRSATSFDDAIRRFYGNVNILPMGADIKSSWCYNKKNIIPSTGSYSDLFQITSKRELESMMILSTHGNSVVKSIIYFPKNSLLFYDKEKGAFEKGKIYFEFPQIVFFQNEKIAIVARTRDGQVLRHDFGTCELTPEDPAYMTVEIEIE